MVPKVERGPITRVNVENWDEQSVPEGSGLTDAELRAVPVPVSGTVTATGPLTDAQLRDTAVPVSGTVTATGPLTDAQLRDTAVPVSNAPVVSAAEDVGFSDESDGAYVTYSGLAGVSHVITGVAWSYSADPTDGALTIVDGISLVFSVHITKGGPGVFVFPIPKKFSVAGTVVIALTKGGAESNSVVSVLNHWMV